MVLEDVIGQLHVVAAIHLQGAFFVTSRGFAIRVGDNGIAEQRVLDIVGDGGGAVGGGREIVADDRLRCGFLRGSCGRSHSDNAEQQCGGGQCVRRFGSDGSA